MKALGAHEARQLGRYRLLAAIGEGGMGRVVLGASPDGRLVAIKQVHPGFAHDEAFRSRFRREVEASRKVSGAYTAAVMDADPDAPTPWLASVYVAGPSLREAVDAAGPMPVEAIRYLAAGLATALVEIHRVGLIHRDLKPSNVLLTEDGPRVIDFGIARAVEGEIDLTHTGSVIGSPGFMSPEQAESGRLTQASDVFSLGTVLVMACTGQSPFTGSSTPQTLYNVVHSHPDLSRVPPQLLPIIGPCLSKIPAQRPTPAQLLDLIGPITPTSTPWPAAVHLQIDRSQAQVKQLLHDPETTAVHTAPVPQFAVPPMAPVPGPPPRRQSNRPLIAGVVGGALVLVCALIAVLLLRDNSIGPMAGTTTETTTSGPPPGTVTTPIAQEFVDALNANDAGHAKRLVCAREDYTPTRIDQVLAEPHQFELGVLGSESEWSVQFEMRGVMKSKKLSLGLLHFSKKEGKWCVSGLDIKPGQY